MDVSDVQFLNKVQNAIEIAWNPSSEQNLKAQAFDFLNLLRSNPSTANVCLNLFIRQPLVTDVIRHFCLEVVNNAVQSGSLDSGTLLSIKDGLLGYSRSNYGTVEGSARVDSPSIQNKLAQTLTYLFEFLYKSGWESFFDDMMSLTGASSDSAATYPSGTLLYLRVLASVHDEIADQLINVAPEKQRLFTELKDLVRARDIAKITTSWQGILSQRRHVHGMITELCLKVISRWVSWTDINLIVNEPTLNSLFELASGNVRDGDDQATKVRDSAVDVFTEIVAKKMKPADKIGLVLYLNLDEVVNRLISSPGLSDARGRADYDTDMAETVAKLVNGIMFDLVKILDASDASDETRRQTEDSVQRFVPHLLRFFADEYDEVCSTVIPSLTDLLGFLRKMSSQGQGIPPPFMQMVGPILDAIISKMRYDDTSSWGEEGEETDEAEFEELRKRLRVLQQLIAAIDENLYIERLRNIVTPTLSVLRVAGASPSWRDVDLAMHEMSLLGELAVVNGGLYHKKRPSNIASETLISLMSLMMESNVAAFPHPSVNLLFMEICVQRNAYFEQHPQYVPAVMEYFVRFVHSKQVKVRARSHNYFLRLVRDLKPQLGPMADRVIRAIEDLLVVKAEVSDEGSNEDTSSNEDSQSTEALFNSQLNLFEAVGCMASAPGVTEDAQAVLARSILGTLTSGVSVDMAAAAAGDERAILQVHHLMMAVGTLARGYSDWVPNKARPPMNEGVTTEFSKASDIILTCLTPAKSSLSIRSAARFAFSRMIGVLGYDVLEQLPRWIDGLLAENSSNDEMATFLKLVDQVIFGFKTEISSVLDRLLTPLLHRVFAGLSKSTDGTDDEIQLGELRREYLNFLLEVLGNGLDSVFVSSSNQSAFEMVISSLEHYARDVTRNSDARLAMAVLTKMTLVWGGPDIKDPASNTASPQPSLPGFDDFLLSRFSALTWQIMSAQGFDAKDANANRVLQEIAILQQTILSRTGQKYLTWLKDVELKPRGASDAAIDDYLRALLTKDQKAFKGFLQSFLQR